MISLTNDSPLRYGSFGVRGSDTLSLSECVVLGLVGDGAWIIKWMFWEKYSAVAAAVAHVTHEY